MTHARAFILSSPQYPPVSLEADKAREVVMRAKKERELNDSEGPEVPNAHGAHGPVAIVLFRLTIFSRSLSLDREPLTCNWDA